MRGGWRGAAAVVLAAVVTVPAGCATGVQSTPVVLGPPPALQGHGDGGDVELSTTVQAFFVRGGHLAPLMRLVPSEPGLSSCLAGLTMPLSAAESAKGIRSALPTGTSSLSARIQGTVAVVEVPDGFDRLAVSNQILAVAQIVYTVTADTYLSGVQMTHGGHLIDLPDESGRLVGRPVGRRDYSQLIQS